MALIHLMAGLQPRALGIAEYSFIAINPRFTVTLNESICYIPIYSANRNIQSFLYMKPFLCVQKNNQHYQIYIKMINIKLRGNTWQKSIINV